MSKEVGVWDCVNLEPPDANENGLIKNLHHRFEKGHIYVRPIFFSKLCGVCTSCGSTNQAHIGNNVVFCLVGTSVYKVTFQVVRSFFLPFESIFSIHDALRREAHHRKVVWSVTLTLCCMDQTSCHKYPQDPNNPLKEIKIFWSVLLFAVSKNSLWEEGKKERKKSWNLDAAKHVQVQSGYEDKDSFKI